MALIKSSLQLHVQGPTIWFLLGERLVLDHGIVNKDSPKIRQFVFAHVRFFDLCAIGKPSSLMVRNVTKQKKNI